MAISVSKQIHLAAHFPGVNNTTVWSDPAAGSHIEFDSFRRFAQAAERGKFDFMFLAEGLRLREQSGRGQRYLRDVAVLIRRQAGQRHARGELRDAGQLPWPGGA